MIVISNTQPAVSRSVQNHQWDKFFENETPDMLSTLLWQMLEDYAVAAMMIKPSLTYIMVQAIQGPSYKILDESPVTRLRWGMQSK